MDYMNFDKENEQLEQDSANLGEDINELSRNQAECSQRIDYILGQVNDLREKWVCRNWNLKKKLQFQT